MIYYEKSYVRRYLWKQWVLTYLRCLWTGDFFYPDAVMGDNRAISGITAHAPEEIDFEDAVAEHEAGTYGDCIGFIYDSGDVILILTDTTAKFRSTASTYAIDIYGDYDDDETND